MEKSNKLTKMFLIFFVYFLYSMYAEKIFNFIGLNDTILIKFLADILFMAFIVFIYRNNLKEDLKFFKKTSIKKIIMLVLLWVIILFGANIICGIITDIISPGYNSDENTEAVYNLYSISTWYTIFKIMIFGTLAEEILYRESIRDNVKNPLLFVIISSVVYTFLNVFFAGVSEGFEIISILLYLTPAVICSIAYLKFDNNILIVSLIKFIYNLIPLTVLLLGLGG